jgi:hypothetical protein
MDGLTPLNPSYVDASFIGHGRVADAQLFSSVTNAQKDGARYRQQATRLRRMDCGKHKTNILVTTRGTGSIKRKT